MKKILIEHVPHSLNYGTTMMAVNLIKSLQVKDLEIYLDTQKNEDIENLKKSLGNIKLEKEIAFKRKSSRIARVIYKAFILPFKLKKYDYIIILGGDDLSEYYGKLNFLVSVFSLNLYPNKKKRLFLLGQSIGPFTGINKKLAKYLIDSSNLYTRDSYCSQYIREELKTNNFKEAADLAFLDLPFQKEKENFYKEYNLLENEYMTIVPSGLIKCYTSNKENYIKKWIDFIKKLLKHYPEKKLVLLGHVVSDDTTSDAIIIEKIISQLTDEEKERVVSITKPILPVEARSILGKSWCTITGRMHAAVSTFQMNKPAISLSYSIKYRGVIGEGLNRNDLVIEAADDKFWEEDKMEKSLFVKIKYLEANYNVIVQEISKSVEEKKVIVQKMLNEIKEKLK